MSKKAGPILVTGGAGFVGSHVAEHFLSAGRDVTVYDDLSRAAAFGLKPTSLSRYNLRYLKRRFPRLRFVKGSISDSTTLSRAARGHSAIIHLAGQVAVTTSLTDPRRDFATNALGTFNVLESARISDANVIFTSTNKVYGENVNTIPTRAGGTRYVYADPRFSRGISETFPVDLCGHSPYGASKLAGDLYTQEYAHTYGLRTSIFRMSCIYGTRQFGREDQGWVAWFTIAAVLGRKLTIYGDGKQVRDVLFVEDLVDALEKALERRLRGEVFNMGGGVSNTLSLLELVKQLESLTGRKLQLGFKGRRYADQKVYISDIRKAKKRLGWSPRIAPKVGVSRLFDWVKGNKGLFDQY